MKNWTLCKVEHHTIHASCLCVALFTVRWIGRGGRKELLLHILTVFHVIFFFYGAVRSGMPAGHNQATN